MKVVAVVVTYNRCVLLKEVLEAVLAQSRPVDEVLVVDNNSSDDTQEYLELLDQVNQTVSHIRLPENTGGAGGFYAGVKAAFYSDADWIWLLDDDAVPTNTALSKLINSGVFAHFTAAASPTLGFVASRVDWIDGSPCYMNVPNVHREWQDIHRTYSNATRIESASFVSVLVSKEAVKQVGFPVKEFFIWFDDVEYTRRITNSENFVGYYVPESVVIHKTQSNLKPMDLRELEPTNLWKFRFGIRNELASTLRGGPGLPRSIYFTLRVLFNLFKYRKAKFFFPVVQALLSGFVFNYRKLIEYPSSGIAK